MLYLNYIDSGVKDYFAAWISFNTSDRKTLGLIELGLVRQHFLCYTTSDILYFCHFHKHLLKNPGSNIFTAIGYNPSRTFLLQLKNQFPKVRTVTVFDDDLFGRILDCKVLLAYLKIEMNFKLQNGQVFFCYKSKDYAVPESIFSLHSFRTFTGMRSNNRTIKPKGAVSFRQLLAQKFII